ncbi:MAG TPA: TolC family protein [Bryobacteraceae bacterium]|nr:TolC family protein [Bryobacteraceae bacterium]
MTSAFSVQFWSKAAAALGVLWLAGCATNPRSSLPSVQQMVGGGGGPAVEWPQTDSEKSSAEQAVRELLARDLTPDTAVRVALVNNRSLRATFEELGVSQADLAAAGRLHNPTLFASSRWPDQAPRGPDVEFSLTADLFDDLLIPLRRKVAAAQLDAVERRVAQAVLDLAAQVKSAAYTLEARQQLRARVETIASANDLAADLARRQYDAGNINQLDLAMQQASAQESRLELMRTDAQIQSDREAINRLLGLSGAETDWKMAGEMPYLPDAEAPLANLEQSAIGQRLDLAVAKAQVALAQTAFDLKRKTRLLPGTVNLGVDTERNPDGSRVTGPQLEIGLPIFDQGQADMARLGAELRRAQDNYEALSAEVGSEVRAARNALLAARAAAEFYDKTLLPQRELIVHQTLLNYNAMQKNTYELLMAKEQEQTAEREGIEAIRDYWVARVQLERALGGSLPLSPPAPAGAPSAP